MKGWNQAAVDRIEQRRSGNPPPPTKQQNPRFITTWNQDKAVMLIGIDCGVKTGIGVWNKTKQCFDLIKTTTMTRAQEIVRQYKLAGHTITVRVEDARLRRYFGENADAKRQGAGSVKRDASNWEAFLKENDIPYEMVHPIKGLTKKTKDDFIKMTGYTGLTSVHSRDAALIVYKM